MPSRTAYARRRILVIAVVRSSAVAASRSIASRTLREAVVTPMSNPAARRVTVSPLRRLARASRGLPVGVETPPPGSPLLAPGADEAGEVVEATGGQRNRGRV